jgi:hypothetical protein
MLLLPLLFAAADPAPVSDVAYIADCTGYATLIVCGCVADTLQQSGDGRMMLDLATARAAAASQTEAETIAAVAAIRSRYGVPDGAPIAPRLDAVLAPAAAACEAKAAK